MPQKLHFKVIHASGQDDVYRASELNHHSPLTKGWQSARFCLYPQDIVIQLETRYRLKKIQILSHQYLIPSKIEFFIGDVPDGIPLSLENVRYARLGYVSLSDNEKTGYKARELKSVHVDAVGHFLKLNIHKNHLNKHNLYNQVGIIAVNVIGSELKKSYEVTDVDFLLDDTKIDLHNSLDGLFNKPDYISPLDDLAFDMYQDPEIAQIIRRLERKKQEAVIQERYDYAKRLKQTIEELQKVGEKLGRMEVEKRQAVESEDFDQARLKKTQMDEYRLQVYRELNLSQLLELAGNHHPVLHQIEPVYRPPSPRIRELPKSPPHYEERMLPTNRTAVKSLDQTENQNYNNNSSRPGQSYDDQMVPVHKIHNQMAVFIDDEPPVDTDFNQETETMSEGDLREASTAIDVFGLALVSKAYSKTWSYREDALTAVYRQMQELPTGNKEESKSVLRAAIFLVKRGIDDKVNAVFKAALTLLRMILTDFVHRHKVGKADITSAVERVLPNLFHKAGDTAVRNRDDAKNFTLEMAKFADVRPTQAVPHECVKPFKMSMAPRHAQSRCEIVEALYQQFGLKNGLTMDNVMNFNMQALQHNAGEVRDVVERLIKQMYRDHGTPVRDYLPPDDEKNRKNTLWRQLFEFFDEVDGKPSKAELKKLKADEEQKKQAEIDDLQRQLQQLRELNGNKANADTSGGKQDPPKRSTQPTVRKKMEPKPKSKTKQAVKDEDDASTFNVDKTCIFCGEKNENFTEEGLDLHYWKNCPMLKRCANCKQVVEISTYTEHMLTECETKSNFSKCPRCSEAISRTEYDQHVAEKSCNAAKSGWNHCPLCHENIPAGEDGWKEHLMGKNSCRQNPRRLLSQSKQPASNTFAAKPSVKGRGGKAMSRPGRK